MFRNLNNQQQVHRVHRVFYIKLVWPVSLAQVLPPPQLIFPSKTWFFGIYLNFQQQKSLKNQYLPYLTKINSIKSCSSRSFNNTKGKFQFLLNFQLWFNLIFRVKIIQYSRTFASQVQMSWNQAHAPHPSSLRAFQRRQEHDLKHPTSVNLITTQNKTNYLPSYILI
jgi:hypothetical protein